MSRLSHLAAVTAVFALVVAACGSSTGTATTVGATTVTTAATTVTTAAPAATTVTTAAPAATTTTQPTPTTTLPFILDGTYAVPDEVAPGTYRLWGGSAARLDENMEIIENYLVSWYGIVIVQPTDSFISVAGWIITVDDFGPVDPIAEGLDNGVYLVGYDIEPGRYEVLDGGFNPPYWARLDDEMGIIDSGTGVGTLEVIVEDGDFAFEYNGVLRLIP